MPPCRLLAFTVLVCVLGGAAAASEPGALQAPAEEQAAQPAPKPVPPPGFAAEFEQRLSPQRRLTSAERADREALKQFYAQRQNEPVWVTPSGYTPAAEAARAEIARADDWGLEASAFRIPALSSSTELTRDQRADAEIALSLAILQYARHARGGRTEPVNLSPNLDRQPQLLEPRKVIEAAVATDSPDAYLRSLHPQHPQFGRLRQQYLALKRNGPPLEEEVVQQKGKSKKRVAKAPTGPTLEKLLVNMEQWRWMPEDLGRFYVWVNIPEYMVRVVKNSHEMHSERVVVGRTNTPTPVFSDEMDQVIFHPYWGVPESIKTNELLPNLMQGDTNVLSRRNLRVSYRGRDINPESVDWSRADMRKYHVYQPPGSGNALGVVKFLFPNKHDVYLHDTPSKGLFNSQVRAFSHGCIRVRQPLKLAEVLLGADQGWTASRVASAVQRGPEDNQIGLRTKVPVHLTYFTAWVEDDGKVRTFADVYGHENRIALGLAGKAHLIKREPENSPPSVQARRLPRSRTAATGSRNTNSGYSYGYTYSGSGNTNTDWMRRVFQD